MRELAPQSKYTEDRISRFLLALRQGATLKIACGFAGFSYTRYRAWMREAEELGEESPYHELPGRVREADAQAAIKWLGSINKAAVAGDWRAGAWCLERRYPEEYGKKAIEFSGRVDSHVTIEKQAADELDKRLASLTNAEIDAIADDDEG